VEIKNPSSADSSDGLNWVYDQVVLEEQGSGWESTYVASPIVWREGSTWHMLYEGAVDYSSGKIGKCESTDGLSWSNRRMVFDKGASGTWDGTAIVSDDIYYDGSNYYFSYHGLDGSVGNMATPTSDFVS
jgi:hypothetical protein